MLCLPGILILTHSYYTALFSNKQNSWLCLLGNLFYYYILMWKQFSHSLNEFVFRFNYLDCSSDSDNTSDNEELDTSSEFRNLESFQKRHFRKKFKVKRRNSRVTPESKETSPKKKAVSYREFVLHNKAPLWNEVSQVYQLDFGGRVTQESAKNFQIEYQGKQVFVSYYFWLKANYNSNITTNNCARLGLFETKLSLMLLKLCFKFCLIC